MTGRGPSGPTWWPALLPGEARSEWCRLQDWVEEFADRYGLDHRVLPPCWYWHSRIVETLAALRDHERGSYHPAAHPTAAVGFVHAVHDIETVLRELTARSGCTGTQHRPNPPNRHDIDAQDWTAFLGADHARRAAILLNTIGDELDPDIDESGPRFGDRDG